MKPTHYTEREGGKWLPWKAKEIFLKDLHPGRLKLRRVNDILFHSLLFKTKRWDCLNGFTKLFHSLEMNEEKKNA